jgi:ABC-type transporter Mla subunit MlaD
MRNVVVFVLLGLACGIPEARYRAALDANQRLRAERAAEHERLEALQASVDELVALIDDLDAEKEKLAAQVTDAKASAEKAEEAEKALEDLNAQLVARQRELSRMSESVSSTWYQSALERARRSAGSVAPAPGIGTGSSD